VSKLAAIRRGWVSSSQDFRERVVPGEHFLVSTKLDTFCYQTVQTACTVLRVVVLTQYRRVTDGRTDGQTDGIAIASTALAMLKCCLEVSAISRARSFKFEQRNMLPLCDSWTNRLRCNTLIMVVDVAIQCECQLYNGCVLRTEVPRP